MKKVSLVLLASDGVSSRVVYHHLAKQYNVKAVIVDENVSLLKMITRRAKSLGWLVVFGQVLFIVYSKVLKFFSKHKIRAIIDDNELKTDRIPEDLITKKINVNSQFVESTLQELNPDIVVINGTRIISENIIDSIPSKFINMHAGITPAYRGVHGGYWALVDEDKENCGVTVHLVDSGIDTGDILYQKRILISKTDNFVTYPIKQLAAGLPLLDSAIKDICNDSVLPISRSEKSVLRYHPTIVQYLLTRLNKGVK